MRFLTIMTLIALVTTPALAAKPNHTDHELLSAYEGSSIYSKDVKQYDEYKIFGIDALK